MPFELATIMDQRHAFVLPARADGANIRARCRRFGISPKTAYTWLRRYEAAGVAGLADRSHRAAPRVRPLRTRHAQRAVAHGLHGSPRHASGRVHPLTLLDDHSRFALALVACTHERAERAAPDSLLSDLRTVGGDPRRNGPTWGSSRTATLTWLQAWLMRLGIRTGV